MQLRRGLALLIGCTFLLAGCGGNDLPTRAEFVDQMKEELDGEMSESLDAAGIDTAAGQEILENFYGCVYDAVKDNEELLEKATDGTIDEAAITAEAGDCTTALSDELIKASTEAAGG